MFVVTPVVGLPNRVPAPSANNLPISVNTTGFRSPVIRFPIAVLLPVNVVPGGVTATGVMVPAVPGGVVGTGIKSPGVVEEPLAVAPRR
jgi:hypothetical protein